MKLDYRILLISLLFGSFVRADVIAYYNADSIKAGATPTTINTWTDLTGNGHNATSSFAGLNPVTQAPSIYGPATAGYSAFGDNHNYLNFNLQGLATASLYSGSSARTVVVAYENAPGSGTLNELAGESQVAGANTWFMLQARTSGVGGGGDPYLAGYASDLSTASAPAADRLTFAVATYDGTKADLSWAYGTGGAVSTTGPAAMSLNTAVSEFSLGFSNGNGASGHSELGLVLVYDSALSPTAAAALIGQMQSYYANPVPEPSTFVLGGLALVGLIVARRRKAN